MKRFHCNHCGLLLTLENDLCTSCGRRLTFLPEVMQMVAWDEAGGEALVHDGRAYRPCHNTQPHAVCNWGVPQDDPSEYCLSCRLTVVIPDLGVAENIPRWQRLEAGKRRLVIGLMNLGVLSIDDVNATPEPTVRFQFLGDRPGHRGPGTVLTGHDQGLITINIAEADDAERERRRAELKEPYRTIVGHLRHEVGHYYWDRMIGPTKRLDSFRQMFGDERADYGAALEAHYQNGPRADWQAQFVSAYASSHPWEDWAETWAHYLHMVDSLETAYESGLWINPRRRSDPRFEPKRPFSANHVGPFDRMIKRWLSLTYILNDFNRGLGLQDAYPFVLSDAVIGKLEFVHETVAAQRRKGRLSAGHPAC